MKDKASAQRLRGKSVLAGESQIQLRNVDPAQENRSMVTVNLNLSDELQRFLNSQIKAGHFESPGRYIEALLKRAKTGNDTLELLLLEGLDSGDPIPLNGDEWARIRQEVGQRLSNGQ